MQLTITSTDGARGRVHRISVARRIGTARFRTRVVTLTDTSVGVVGLTDLEAIVAKRLDGELFRHELFGLSFEEREELHSGLIGIYATLAPV